MTGESLAIVVALRVTGTERKTPNPRARREKVRRDKTPLVSHPFPWTDAETRPEGYDRQESSTYESGRAERSDLLRRS